MITKYILLSPQFSRKLILSVLFVVWKNARIVISVPDKVQTVLIQLPNVFKRTNLTSLSC